MTYSDFGEPALVDLKSLQHIRPEASPRELTKRSFLILIILFGFLCGTLLGVVLAQRLFITNFDYISMGIYSADQPLALPNLQTMTADSVDDEAALLRVVDYYNQHREEIHIMLNERDDERARAMFAMYLIHISHRYSPMTDPGSFTAYLEQPFMHCGSATHYQRLISTALGLETRVVSISGGTHTWLEVRLNDQWEVFDSTINLWIDKAGIELERGAPRTYRAFYTPLLDSSYEQDEYTLMAARLRFQMRGLGLYYSPLAYLEVAY